MKKTIYNSISLLTILMLLAASVGACKNESKSPVFDNRDASRLQVLAAKTHFDTSGGAGAVQLNQVGFTYAIDGATWCTVTPVGDKGLRVEVEPNPLPKSRNTVIIVSKGNEKVSIPVIQIGSRDDATLPAEVNFENEGGSQSFATEFDSQPTITLSDGGESWLTAEVSGDALVLTAKPNYLTTERSTTLQITAGLYQTSITVTQKGAPLPERPAEPATINNINEILGKYTFKYKLTDDKIWTQDVELVKGNKANEVILKGLAVDFVLTVEHNNLKLTSSQTMPSGLYLFYGSGLGDNQCLELDFLNEDKAVFLAPAMKRGSAFSFTFTSNSKDKCEVKDNDNKGTGVFKNPRGIVIYDSNNNEFYFGPNDETGVFFDFSMEQKI